MLSTSTIFMIIIFVIALPVLAFYLNRLRYEWRTQLKEIAVLKWENRLLTKELQQAKDGFHLQECEYAQSLEAMDKDLDGSVRLHE